ncbi:hypothetical protein C8A00DRAFT_40605 [Chaetomidium leptoderma]|uniref:Uncharacterized protein n=1 Tax=Chaetomidium leptoderma TaxID=669021 RepID=A0AAN6VSJ3_9PEZI|nr:hypothetical protein C8A00DRAFT_40605 [Chaetomidium leptoderma]
MWLMKRSRTGNHPEVPDIRCQPLLKQPVANFSYPRTDFIHLYRKELPGIRDSHGSESSPPPMVEDHGSDLSTEDDCQYRVTGADLWNSWHAREKEGKKPDYPALINSTPRVHETQSPMARENPQATRGPLSSGSQNRQVTRPMVVSCPEQRPHPPRPPPKGCYSLFPPPDVSHQRSLAPLQIPSVPRQPGLEPSPLSLNFPPTPSSRNIFTDAKGNAVVMFRPSSSRATTPGSVHGGSIAASSSDSIPLLLRSPGPTPPDSPSGTSSSSEAPNNPSIKPVKSRSPSHTNLRNFSLSKMTTQSSPSLANLAKTHHQQQPQPPTPKTPKTRPQPTTPTTPTSTTALYDRPLPPLPTQMQQQQQPKPPSPPPHISVFETDTDDDDDSDNEDDTGRLRPRTGGGSGGGGETKNFARRFMHGLVHHHHHLGSQHDNKKQGAEQHKRSVSDEGPSTSAASGGERGSGGGRSGISRTLNAAARYRRGGGEARAAVSMDLPRRSGGGGGGGAGRLRYQQVGEELEKGGGGGGGRFWGGKGGGGEMLWERILRRKG